MELNEEAPPAKQPKLDTDSSVNEPYDTTKCIKSSYASEVSRRLYSDNGTADVFFTFENSSVRVSAHKCVLASASKVFRRLVYDPMAIDGNILLPETPAEAFKIVLQFCYLDEFKLKLDYITDVMKLLDYYEMDECLELCGRFWAENWNIDDICSAYDWAINLPNMTEFRDFCERKISVHSDAVFQTDGFLSCSPTVLDHILSLNSLLSDESVVLGACLKWARKQCELNVKDPHDMENLREHLKGKPDPSTQQRKSLLYKIRYGSMTHNAFLTHMDEYDGLIDDVKDYADVMRLLCHDNRLKTGKFQTEPRGQIPATWCNGNALECAFRTNSHAMYRRLMGSRFSSVLTTNQPILLSDLQTGQIKQQHNSPFGQRQNSLVLNQISIELKINELPMESNVNGGTSKLLLHQFKYPSLSESNESYYQFKPSLIILKPNFEYHFQFDLPSLAANISYSCENVELEREIKLDKGVTIQIRAENGNFILKNFLLIPL